MSEFTEEEIRQNVQEGLKKAGELKGASWKTSGGVFKVLTSAQYGGVVGIMPWDEILPYFAEGERVLRDGWVPFKVDEISILKYQTAIRLKT